MNEDSTQTKEIGADGHRKFLKLMVRVDGLLTRLDSLKDSKDPEEVKRELGNLVGGLVVAGIFKELEEYRGRIPYVNSYMREIIDGLKRMRKITEDSY